MGVRGLQYYLETICTSASPEVCIETLVEKQRKHGNGEPLVIIVDGSSCIRHLYGDLEWIGGAQLIQFGEMAKCFVQAFRDIGLDPVFFFDGPTIEAKRTTWVKRRYGTLKSAYYVLHIIDNGVASHNISKENHFLLPPGMGQLARVIFEIICGCKVYQSLTECDEEIVEYARTHNAFAILGQDTDFVIFDAGPTLYLSMKHLNLEDMTTRLYDRWELANRLKIYPFQLPLLATFMGNDIVSFDDLKEFHRWVSRKNKTYLVPNLARYISQLPTDHEELFRMAPEISLKVLGNPVRASDIVASIKSYDAFPKKDYEEAERGKRSAWSQLVAEARRRHRTNQFPSMVYAIMMGLPYESSTSLEDYRKTDIPSFASASRPIRQRMYGILLQEKPLPPSGYHEVAEWCMAGRGSLDEANYVRAVPPEQAHPGLMALWSGSHELRSVRWKLFVHSVSPNLDVERVRSTLRSYLVIPTLILFYINELHCLESWEVDAMLATATSLKNYNSAMLEKLPADPMSSRSIRVANIIMRSTFVLYILLACCGYPLSVEKTAPWLFFDGKLFQKKYREAQNWSTHEQLCEHKVDILEDFQLARDIVFSNGSSY